MIIDTAGFDDGGTLGTMRVERTKAVLNRDVYKRQFKKFMSEEELSAIYERLGAEKGDVILIVADKNSTVLSTLGALRLEMCIRDRSRRLRIP